MKVVAQVQWPFYVGGLYGPTKGPVKKRMIPTFLRISGFTRIDRHQMISLVKDAIAESGGWVMDFHMFSNTSICINFELSVKHIEKLYDSLMRTNLHLSQDSHDLLTKCCNEEERPVEGSVKDIAGALHITFIHNEPDLRIEVPPIPG